MAIYTEIGTLPPNPNSRSLAYPHVPYFELDVVDASRTQRQTLHQVLPCTHSATRILEIRELPI